MAQGDPLCLAACPARYLLASQHRYADYLCKLLHQDDDMPATYGQTLLLKRIVCRCRGRRASLGCGSGVSTGELVAWVAGREALCALLSLCLGGRGLPPPCLPVSRSKLSLFAAHLAEAQHAQHGGHGHSRRGGAGAEAGRTMLVVYQRGKKKFAFGATLTSAGSGVRGGGDGCGRC